MQYKFDRSIVGGTFDRFHLGHQKLLATAFENSEKVIIGIATNDLFKDKNFAHLIEDYKEREKSVLAFVKEKGFTSRSEIVPIQDFYGTSLTDKNLDAIFITESNKENVEKMNEARQKKGFKPLEIVIVDYVLGNDNEIVSSERIRRGLIDREGNSYRNLFTKQKQFFLPDDERDELRHPIGTVATDMTNVIQTLAERAMLIAVGDIVAQSAVEAGRKADINIIDGKTRRHSLHQSSHSFSDMTHRQTDNPAGTITQEAAKSLIAAMRDYELTHAEQLIDVNGEEDLLAIPAILLAPLNSVVLYGQFGIGIVVVHVSEQNKKRVYNLFRKFQ